MSSIASSIDEVARVYAQSLFELAETAGGEEKIHSVGDDVEAIANILRGDKGIAEFFRSPIIDIEKRGHALRRVFDGSTSDLVLRFLLVLNAKGRLGRVDDIADAYTELSHERFGRVEVDVYTPGGSITAEALEALRTKIKDRLGRDPVFHQYADPSMIGGLTLKIGDELIDGSVRGRLRRMREDLRQNGIQKVRETPERFLEEND